jgi:hypothetical protein
MRSIVILVVHVARFIKQLQVRIWGGSEVKRAVHAGRYRNIERVALLKRDSPIDERLIGSDRNSQRICVRLKRC